jgi:hypothetical protein
MPKANEYVYIKRWGECLGSFPYYIADQQAKAAAEGAPLTAIYHRDGEGWHTIEQVTNANTRHFFTVRGWMTPEWTVPAKS